MIRSVRRVELCSGVHEGGGGHASHGNAQGQEEQELQLLLKAEEEQLTKSSCDKTFMSEAEKHKPDIRISFR